MRSAILDPTDCVITVLQCIYQQLVVCEFTQKVLKVNRTEQLLHDDFFFLADHSGGVQRAHSLTSKDLKTSGVQRQSVLAWQEKRYVKIDTHGLL